jgi:hypothetical protein
MLNYRGVEMLRVKLKVSKSALQWRRRARAREG